MATISPSFQSVLETDVTRLDIGPLPSLDDFARDGFLNLGNHDNTFRFDTSTDLKVNAQGGDDDIRLFGTGDDTVFAGSGDDYVNSGDGNDTVFGGAGHDNIVSLGGDDTLDGGAGNDYVVGGSGHDTVIGGAGQDIVDGGNDADVMIGGDGADRFVFDRASDMVRGLDATDVDLILDFSRAEGDRIDLHNMDADETQSGFSDFTFTTHASTAAGTVWLGRAIGGMQSIFLNVDGGTADFEIRVDLSSNGGLGLAASDFLL